MPYKNIEDRRECARRNRNTSKETAAKKRYLESYPWIKTLSAIRSRCLNKSHHYFKKGIKNFLNSKDIKFLWFRDMAYKLTKPSIDRIDSSGNYCLDNCRFIELHENLTRSKSCRTI